MIGSPFKFRPKSITIRLISTVQLRNRFVVKYIQNDSVSERKSPAVHFHKLISAQISFSNSFIIYGNTPFCSHPFARTIPPLPRICLCSRWQTNLLVGYRPMENKKSERKSTRLMVSVSDGRVSFRNDHTRRPYSTTPCDDLHSSYYLAWCPKSLTVTVWRN